MVANQSAVARGCLTEEPLKQIHEEVRARLARAGATLDAVYYCPHHPSKGVAPYGILCDCRKPSTGMIRRASEELGLESARSYVVGDQAIDMELAAGVGATGVWICNSAKAQKDIAGGVPRLARDLWDAAQWIAVSS